jgi:prepilin-type N-terminal cleavage/methylation domain-containing protein
MSISSASHSPKKMSNRKAFTLIEVMISVVILAIGLTAVLRSFLQCLNGIEASRDYMLSSSAAKAKMDGILEASVSGNTTRVNITNVTITIDNVTGGTEIMGGRKFEWSIAMTAVTQPAGLAGNFTDAAVTYSWKEGARKPRLSCHMYIPQVKEAPEQEK